MDLQQKTTINTMHHVRIPPIIKTAFSAGQFLLESSAVTVSCFEKVSWFDLPLPEKHEERWRMPGSRFSNCVWRTGQIGYLHTTSKSIVLDNMNMSKDISLFLFSFNILCGWKPHIHTSTRPKINLKHRLEIYVALMFQNYSGIYFLLSFYEENA